MNRRNDTHRDLYTTDVPWNTAVVWRSANRSQSHLTELQKKGSPSFTRDSASATGQWVAPASCQASICRGKVSAVPTVLPTRRSVTCKGSESQCPNKSVLDTIVCPLTVIMTIIMDRLISLQNTDGFNLTNDIPAEILRNWIIILLAVDLTLWLPKKNSVEVQGTEFLALCLRLADTDALFHILHVWLGRAGEMRYCSLRHHKWFVFNFRF